MTLTLSERFEEYLNDAKDYAERVLMRYLPEAEGLQKTLIEAMNYSLLAGGKRLRPVLMLETWRMFGGNDERLITPFMAAMEMIHTFSLVHDDLPAMDNDMYRRGRKTTHAVYGAGMATLAGDGLLNLAFETALKATGLGHDGRVIEALKVLALKAGIYGMAGGQCADIESENAENITDDVIAFVNEHKTACMIESSLMIGAVLAGADSESVKRLERAGSCLGIAFQIRDDILNRTGTQQELGKPVGSDDEMGKTNYVFLHGLDEAQRKVVELSSEAVSIFDGLYAARNIGYAFLSELARKMEGRKK
ncbi:MAG: polyprenyl synthetase family protein [Synergistaceae bacterium]|nr:polyprenyl synthetase family protein [Synergistaceae bacterium]